MGNRSQNGPNLTISSFEPRLRTKIEVRVRVNFDFEFTLRVRVSSEYKLNMQARGKRSTIVIARETRRAENIFEIINFQPIKSYELISVISKFVNFLNFDSYAPLFFALGYAFIKLIDFS